MNFQKLGVNLNKCINEEYRIRVGRYQSKEITGELFVITNSDNIFMVGSDDSSCFKYFDIIPNEAIVTPIDKELENNPVSYDEVDINNKSSLRGYFPKDEEGVEMFECVQSVPPRFRKDALDVFESPNNRDVWDMYTIDKAWTYFLEYVIEEMTEEEKETYGFGECHGAFCQ